MPSKKNPVGRPAGPKKVTITAKVLLTTDKEIRKRAKASSIGAVLDEAFQPEPTVTAAGFAI